MNADENPIKFTDKQKFFDVVGENFKDNNEHFITAKRLRKITKDIIETFWPSKNKVIYTLKGIFINGQIITDGSGNQLFRPNYINDGVDLSTLKNKKLYHAGLNTGLTGYVNCTDTVEYASTTCLKLDQTYTASSSFYLMYFDNSEVDVNVKDNGSITLEVENDIDILNINIAKCDDVSVDGSKYIFPSLKITTLKLKNDTKENGREVKIVNESPIIANFIPCINADYCFNAIYHITSILIPDSQTSHHDVWEPYVLNLMYWNKKWYADGQHIN